MPRAYFRVDVAALRRDHDGSHGQERIGEWGQHKTFDVDESVGLEEASAEATVFADDLTLSLPYNTPYAVRVVLVTERTWTTAYPEE